MFRFIPVFFFILIALPGLVYSQTQFIGKIVDQETKETLPGAYVFLKENNGETITGAVTNENGNFRIKIPSQDSFILEVSFLGYETYQQKLKNSSGRNLGTIELVMEGETLETFEIQGSMLSGEIKGDTVAFNAD